MYGDWTLLQRLEKRMSWPKYQVDNELIIGGAAILGTLWVCIFIYICR